MTKPFIRVEIGLSEDQLVAIYPEGRPDMIVLEEIDSGFNLVLTKDDIESLAYHLKHMITYLES